MGLDIRGYAPGKDFPLAGYAALMGGWTVVGGAAAVLGARRKLRLGIRDLLLLGPAVHKLTRILTRDWVTAPLRAPFTEYVESASGGELEERARGKGLRKAVGDLLTCPYCTGPWVAAGLLALWALRPKESRILETIFAGVAASDFLHRSYSLLEAKRGSQQAQKRELELETRRLEEARA